MFFFIIGSPRDVRVSFCASRLISARNSYLLLAKHYFDNAKNRFGSSKLTQNYPSDQVDPNLSQWLPYTTCQEAWLLKMVIKKMSLLFIFSLKYQRVILSCIKKKVLRKSMIKLYCCSRYKYWCVDKFGLKYNYIFSCRDENQTIDPSVSSQTWVHIIY